MIGIDFGSRFVKVCFVKEDEIILAEVFENINEESNIRKIKSFLRKNKIKDKRAATTVNIDKVKILELEVPKLPYYELENALKLQAIASLEISLSDFDKYYDYDYSILNDKVNTSDVLFAATDRTEINGLLKTIWQCGLIPVCVTLNTICLMKSFLKDKENTLTEHQTILLLHIGAMHTDILLFKDGEMIFSKEVGCGWIGNNIEEKITVQKNIVSNDNSEKTKNETITNEEIDIKEALIEAFETIERSINYFLSNGTISGIDKVVLSGGVANLSGIDLFLTDVFNTIVDVWQPFKQKELQNIGPFLPIAYGLTMLEDK